MNLTTKFLDRLSMFFWWNVMTIGWFVGIFSSKIFEANETWLFNFSKNYTKKFK